MQKNVKQLVTDLLRLQEKYQFTRRIMMTRERFEVVTESSQEAGLDIHDERLKEPLIEHVGHLPILATHLHEHIEHASRVNLGRSLTMLAIHDIGETELGDVFAYTKSDQQEADEIQKARELLSPALVLYFEEYELSESFDAKYARAVDALAPLLQTIELVGYMHTRLLKHGGSIEKIVLKKRHLFVWDLVLLEIFDLCLQQAVAYEAGKEFPFPVVLNDLRVENKKLSNMSVIYG